MENIYKVMCVCVSCSPRVRIHYAVCAYTIDIVVANKYNKNTKTLQHNGFECDECLITCAMHSHYHITDIYDLYVQHYIRYLYVLKINALTALFCVAKLPNKFLLFFWPSNIRHHSRQPAAPPDTKQRKKK